MSADPAVARRLVLDFVATSRELLCPFLLSPARFGAELTTVMRSHRLDNDSYRVDMMVEEVLTNLLVKYRIGGQVFSEESGWRRIGDSADYTVVCDPFDNTFLCTRAFRDSSVVIAIADTRGDLLCCAIGDLATRAAFLADPDGAYMLEQDGAGCWQQPQQAMTSTVTRLQDAFVVLPALLRPDRLQALAFPELVGNARHLLTMDGAIFFGRLAAGYIDAYVDVVVGQPVYEIPALELITRAGGIVTDGHGEPLDLPRIVSLIEADPDGRIGVVAAATAELHADIMNALGR